MIQEIGCVLNVQVDPSHPKYNELLLFIANGNVSKQKALLHGIIKDHDQLTKPPGGRYHYNPEDLKIEKLQPRTGVDRIDTTQSFEVAIRYSHNQLSRP